jgi:UDP-2,3-diacylglucosamine pyrophosphatase LpxH
MKIREIEVSVISDIHLATHACNPRMVLKYLKSIHPKILVLNGDIIDSWRFSRNYFPKPQLKVIRQFIKMMEKGVQIFYITGNHDEFLRKFNQTEIGKLKIVNQLILDLDGLKTWIFHGDIFDNTIHKTKWLAKLGAGAYGLLTLFNKIVNRILKWSGKSEVIIYKSITNYLAKENLNLSKFETAIGNAAISQGYQTVICGHTHIPKEKDINIQGVTIKYLNCGDWVEHFTATEYFDGRWHLHYHDGLDDETQTDDIDVPEKQQLYQLLVKELVFANTL